jgi:hypothetical protein
LHDQDKEKKMHIFGYVALFLPLLGFAAIGDSPPSQAYLALETGIHNYQAEREALTDAEIQEMLSRGNTLLQKTDLVDSLIHGGSALFPHASILKCGDQIAAVVQAALFAAHQSGKNKILVLGVLHSLSEEILTGRIREIRGEDVSDYPCRGIFGPNLPHEAILKREYSLDNFLFLLNHAVRLSGLPSPEIVIRFPNHVFGNAETLSGIDELGEIAKESIVVATGDLRHYGTAYGIPIQEAMPIGKKALAFAQKEIQAGLDLLQTDDLLQFRNLCYKTICDAFEVGQLLRFLLGPLEGTLHELRLVDVSDLFEGHPEPNWVATAIVELKPVKKGESS